MSAATPASDEPGGTAAVPQPVARPALPSLEILAPAPGAGGVAVQADADGTLRTTSAVVHVLGRSTADARVRVAGEPAEVFTSGVFARDRLPLAPGRNTIVIEAVSPAGASTAQTIVVERVEPPPGPDWPPDRDWIDGASLEPGDDHVVAPGEAVEFSCRATPGRVLQLRLPGPPRWQPLAEVAPGRYRALLAFPVDGDIDPAPPAFRLLPRRRGARPLVALGPAAVGQWRDDPARVVAVVEGGVELRHGLHAVRLGGPFWPPMPAGTLLAATGRRAGHVRVRLAPGVEAWAPEATVVPAPSGTRPPRAVFTNAAVRPDPARPGVDRIVLPLPAAVPVAVQPETDAEGRHRLVIDVFGAHAAATWITHASGLQAVRELTAEPHGAGVVRVRARLAGGRLWGWRVDREPERLVVHVIAPPPRVAEGGPLAGLRVAVEAGHGGPGNLGAVGATGTPEKDFNRWTAELLTAELSAAGAQVITLREGDDNPTLAERTRRAEAAGAQLLVSVHANAASTERGFLRVAGVSTYYKHTPSMPIAAAVQRRLLAETGLADFGLVGNFNYLPLRATTTMPAILVEQAFVSHPGDEARLLDPAFRARLARAVRLGLEDGLAR